MLPKTLYLVLLMLLLLLLLHEDEKSIVALNLLLFLHCILAVRIRVLLLRVSTLVGALCLIHCYLLGVEACKRGVLWVMLLSLIKDAVELDKVSLEGGRKAQAARLVHDKVIVESEKLWQQRADAKD